MGPMMVAMQRTNYSQRRDGSVGGTFSTGDPACSKLIGGGDGNNTMASSTPTNSEDDEMISRQVASRLTTQLHIPIFVSSALYGGNMPTAIASLCSDVGAEGGGLLPQRAAALAERAIYNLLKDKVQ